MDVDTSPPRWPGSIRVALFIAGLAGSWYAVLSAVHHL